MPQTGAMTGAMTGAVELRVTEPRWDRAALAPLAERAIGATLARLDLSPAVYSVSLLACDDTEIARLNAAFRGKPQATNVLSWPSEDRAAPEDGAPPARPDGPMDEELGDIAIAHETCAREAEAQGKPFADHVTHLLVHGVLHLLGYDHLRDKDAALMEGLEVEILASLGLPDPYRDTGLDIDAVDAS